VRLQLTNLLGPEQLEFLQSVCSATLKQRVKAGNLIALPLRQLCRTSHKGRRVPRKRPPSSERPAQPNEPVFVKPLICSIVHGTRPYFCGRSWAILLLEKERLH
jgi:hypothetical protein